MTTLGKNGIIREFKKGLELRGTDKEVSGGALEVTGSSIYDTPSLPQACKAIRDLSFDGHPQITAETSHLTFEEAGIMDLSPEFLEEFSENFEELAETKERKEERKYEVEQRAEERCKDSLGYRFRSWIWTPLMKSFLNPTSYLRHQKVDAEESDERYQKLHDEFVEKESSIKESAPVVILDDEGIEVRGYYFWPQLYSSASLEDGIKTKLSAEVSDPRNVDLDNPVIRKGFSPENTESTQISYTGWSIGSSRDGGDDDIYTLEVGMDTEMSSEALNEFIERVYFSS